MDPQPVIGEMWGSQTVTTAVFVIGTPELAGAVVLMVPRRPYRHSSA
ncbi:MAG: hypothetical protein ACRDRH_08605 [Pseudonocardia sp.]